MDSGYEDYATDYSLLFEGEVFTRPDGSAGVTDDDDLFATEYPLVTWRMLGQDEVSRFRMAGEAVRRLREQGKGVPEIMAAFKLTDPSAIRRLEGVLDWLTVAGQDPRAAALGGLSKRTFLAVVSRSILTVDDLAEKASELSRLPAFGPTQMSDIRNLLTESHRETGLRQ